MLDMCMPSSSGSGAYADTTAAASRCLSSGGSVSQPVTLDCVACNDTSASMQECQRRW